MGGAPIAANYIGLPVHSFANAPGTFGYTRQTKRRNFGRGKGQTKEEPISSSAKRHPVKKKILLFSFSLTLVFWTFAKDARMSKSTTCQKATRGKTLNAFQVSQQSGCRRIL